MLATDIPRDIVGARKAGFHLAVQIINNFDHGEEDDGTQPDAVITHMTELLDLLGSRTQPDKTHELALHPELKQNARDPFRCRRYSVLSA